MSVLRLFNFLEEASRDMKTVDKENESFFVYALILQLVKTVELFLSTSQDSTTAAFSHTFPIFPPLP